MLAINRPTYAYNHGVFFYNQQYYNQRILYHTFWSAIYLLCSSKFYQWRSDKSYLFVIHVLNFADHLQPCNVPYLSCMALKCLACLKNCLRHASMFYSDCQSLSCQNQMCLSYSDITQYIPLLHIFQIPPIENTYTYIYIYILMFICNVWNLSRI